MYVVQTTGTVGPDGHLIVQIPSEVPTGDYQVVIVLEEPPATVKEARHTKRRIRWGDFPVADVGPWPENLSLRREDMYGDWGR